jgi:hypothetical protein
MLASPPPPPPPRPPVASAAPTPEGKMITSKRLESRPASRALGKTTSNGNSNCSRMKRVQPDGIEPPY